MNCLKSLSPRTSFVSSNRDSILRLDYILRMKKLVVQQDAGNYDNRNFESCSLCTFLNVCKPSKDSVKTILCQTFKQPLLENAKYFSYQ